MLIMIKTRRSRVPTTLALQHARACLIIQRCRDRAERRDGFPTKREARAGGALCFSCFWSRSDVGQNAAAPRQGLGSNYPVLILDSSSSSSAPISLDMPVDTITTILCSARTSDTDSSIDRDGNENAHFTDSSFLRGITVTSSGRFSSNGQLIRRLMYCCTIADYHLKRSSASLTELTNISPRKAGHVSMKMT